MPSISVPRDVFQEHVTEPSVFPGSEARDAEHSLLLPLVLCRHGHHYRQVLDGQHSALV